MKTVTWELKETFHFPQLYGSPSNVPDIKIVPQSTNTVSGDSVRLNGIYHIAANVEFKPFEGTFPRPYDGVVIDFIEMQEEDNNGYFEYAVPLTVDIPRERIQNGYIPSLEVQDVKMHYPFPGCVEVGWTVACSYAEPADKAEEAVGMKGAATYTLEVDEELNMSDAVEVPTQTVVFESSSSSSSSSTSSTPDYEYESVETVFEESKSSAMDEEESIEEQHPVVQPVAVTQPVVHAVEVVDVAEDKSLAKKNQSELNFLNDLKDTYSVFTFRNDQI
ncbi:hypothetical protein ACFOZY_05420 [Chungangia koreensis]|uniref:Uncharacterized protein n=1 Tax=Chungangia koreensis TaxID=752657 RepID=A0ABV8X359_9LACT